MASQVPDNWKTVKRDSFTFQKQWLKGPQIVLSSIRTQERNICSKVFILLALLNYNSNRDSYFVTIESTNVFSDNFWYGII